MTQNIFTDIAPAIGFEGTVVDALDDKVNTRYERVIINRSTDNISVVEQNGLVYPVYPDISTFENAVIIKECWTFPEIALPDVRDLLNSEARCSDSIILKQWREQYKDTLLTASYGSFKLELEHRISLDTLREFKAIYHYHTNLLIGTLRPVEMLEHPQSILGKERLALNYDTLLRCKESVGWRVELVDNQRVLGDGVYLHSHELGIVHVKPIQDPVRKSCLIYVGSTGGDHVDHFIYELDNIPDTLNDISFFKTLREAKEHQHKLQSKDLEHERNMLDQKRKLQEAEFKHKIELEDMKATNQLFEKELEFLRKRRDERKEAQDEINRQEQHQFRTEDRNFKREEHQQKREEMSLKSILTWATAVIGGVTLANKLF